MEDALARNKKKSGRRSKSVLILVVMEDALARMPRINNNFIKL